MIELHDLSSDESFDNTTSLNVSHSPSITSASLEQCLSNNVTYNASNIKMFLKEQQEKYKFVDNHQVNHRKPSPCWIQFALPAVKGANNRNAIIKKYSSGSTGTGRGPSINWRVGRGRPEMSTTRGGRDGGEVTRGTGGAGNTQKNCSRGSAGRG